MGRQHLILTITILLICLRSASQAVVEPKRDSIRTLLNSKVLPQNFYNRQLGFFCQKELQLQQATKLPLFIRLGSKEYVDRLEGKRREIQFHH